MGGGVFISWTRGLNKCSEFWAEGILSFAMR